MMDFSIIFNPHGSLIIFEEVLPYTIMGYDDNCPCSLFQYVANVHDRRPDTPVINYPGIPDNIVIYPQENPLPI